MYCGLRDNDSLGSTGGCCWAERTGSIVVHTGVSSADLVRAEEVVETAANGSLLEPVAGPASVSCSLGSESDCIVPHSGGKSPSVSDAVMLGVQDLVRIGRGRGLCFRLLLIGMNLEYTRDCLKGVSGIFPGIVLTVLQDDLCFRDDLYFFFFQWDLLLQLVSSSSCSRWRFFRLL